MKVFQTELPGIGVRYTLRFDAGGELIVLTHNDGNREVFWRAGPRSDSERLFELDEDDARKFSDVLEGTYFQPVEEGLEDVFENARIRWIHVDEESPLAGQTIGEAGIRSRTGVTILGLRRDERIITDIDSDTRIEPDDVLVGVGSEASHSKLGAMLD
ncbi:MAG: TrkA C-terminal domain-containing protein [Halobacteriales archaeon]|nr:TrkA C-terminal domain-containing protein [Halobacteriales archaeon]